MVETGVYIQKSFERQLKVPVILTGAMAPLGFEGSDGQQTSLKACWRRSYFAVESLSSFLGRYTRLTRHAKIESGTRSFRFRNDCGQLSSDIRFQ